MKGTNIIRVNSATLMELAQEYFDARASGSAAEFVVTGVKTVTRGHGAVDVEFRIEPRAEGLRE